MSFFGLAKSQPRDMFWFGRQSILLLFIRYGSGQSPARNLARGSWVLIGLTCSKNNQSESDSGKKKSGPTQPSALYLLLWVPLCYLMECHCRAKRTTLLCWHGTYLVLVYIVLVPPHLNVWVNSATLEWWTKIGILIGISKKECLGNFNAMWKHTLLLDY